MRLIVFCTALLVCCATLAAIPPALTEWRDWVLATQPDAECPRQAAQLQRRNCAWPGRLELAVEAGGAEFNQPWTVYGDSWVTLPGDREQWPLEVTSNGRPAPVLERDGRPALRLQAGSHQLRGRWRWREAPQSLAVPADTALLALTLAGAPVAAPALENGRLWLRAPEQGAAGADNTARLEVFRVLRDDIPLRLDTVLRLSVAGKPRELVLGRLLLEGAEPLQFESPLPARIESDGRLRVQVRAGEWTLQLRARLAGDRDRFRMERLDDGWPAQELWAFAADPGLRRVQLGGAPAVDPSQLDLPPELAGLPTFLLNPDTELTLAQQYRGDAAPAANQLQLDRTLWLDFDGGGATALDRIDGNMTQGWRLQAQPALALGRVRVNGQPQLVTRLGREQPPGVEIRDPGVRLEALSRVDDLAALDASGWQSDFQGVRLALQLPPGWKLWHAAGPDQVSDSWLTGWDLWDIFLALLIVGACFRLLGPRWAALAALAVALAFHERESPVALFLPLLAVVALLRVVAAGRLRGWLLRGGYVFGALLALAVLVFAVEQVRQGIYPQLEQSWFAVVHAGDEADAAAESSRNRLEEVVVAAPQRSAAMMAQRKVMAPPPPAPQRPRYQPDSNVQTGPGRPAWSWRAAQLEWSGPVTAGQPLDLYLTGPWLTRLLKFLEVVLVAALAVALWRALLGARPAPPRAGLTALGPLSLLSLAALLGLAPVGAPPALAADFPPEQLLQEYRERLLQAPDCAPECAAINALDLRLDNGQLRLRLDVSAGSRLGLPLPLTTGWQPRTVLVGERAADGLLRQAQALLLPLEPGRHSVVLEGPVAADEVGLQFTLAPRNVSVAAEGWEVFGLGRQGLAANTLQLQKRERSERGDRLLAELPKPFVLVQREIRMDLDWQVITTVTRLAPAEGAINLSLPLLPGESVLNAELPVAEGRAAVSLGARQAQLQWRSVLPAAPQLVLAAPDTAQWVESWIVAPSPRWHVEGEGLTPIKGEGGEMLRWRPWPGERLTLNARPPAAVSGPVTTVERAGLTLAPGRRSAALTLQLEIASSVGGDYPLALQEPGELTRLAVNGNELSQARGEALLVPLSPGTNRVEVAWELPRGAALNTATPALALSSPATNVSLALQLPQDRWPLWLRGPALGPAMLYWGVLVVIVALALGLGQLVRRQRLSIPLGPWQWLLLGIGMSTVNLAGSVVVVLWFFAMEARRRIAMPAARWQHNLIQLGLVALSLAALLCLFATVPESLLSAPDMQVAGNGSHNYAYRWYQDRSGGQLPEAAVFSLPLWVYRVAMLAWSLWLVFALLRWVHWGWQAFCAGRAWLPKPAPAQPTQPPAA